MNVNLDVHQTSSNPKAGNDLDVYSIDQKKWHRQSKARFFANRIALVICAYDVRNSGSIGPPMLQKAFYFNCTFWGGRMITCRLIFVFLENLVPAYEVAVSIVPVRICG